MVAKKRSEKYFKFIIYLVVVVLVNLAGLSLFFRWDLTKDGVYSLSDVSKKVVSTLKEPLTVKVFFTKNLPAPYNGTERYLRDLLEEYAVHGNRYFNYQFYDVSPASEGAASSSTENQQMASSYGIQPLQIQQLENDEFKSTLAYMGLVIIHGDIVEKIPSITSTDGLEYKLTTAFQKANNKISTLLALSQNIQVKLILSDTLKSVGPVFGIDELPKLPDTVEAAVKNLNRTNYNRISYSFSNPSTDEEKKALSDKYHLMRLKWPDIESKNIAAGNGEVGLVMSYGDKTASLPILTEVRIPLFGTQYHLASADEIKEMIDDEVETLTNSNENIGYLADHGTLSLNSSQASMMGLQTNGDLTTFNELLGKTYNVRQINLAKDSIPPDLQCLIIARPTEPFTDWELFQIDQALMRGQNLALFLEPFKETVNKQAAAMGFQNQVSYEPLDTGLQKLLAHWGIEIGKSVVMDEKCYKQTRSQAMGGGKQPIYYAPIIQPENINQSLPMMHNIKEFLALKDSPLILHEDTLKKNNLKATVVFSSSDKSWEMKAPINLNPMYHSPPTSDDAFKKEPLACLVEGDFPSYFAGKQIPEKPSDESKDKDTDKDKEKKKGDVQEEALKDSNKTASVASQVTSEGAIIAKGKPAKVFIIGSGEMLRDDLLDTDGTTPNSMFVMNMIDTLNGHEDIALMRSKTQSQNPLNKTSPLLKTVVKAFNIAGLPILVVFFGLFVWIRRHVRRKAIQKMFETNQGA